MREDIHDEGLILTEDMCLMLTNKVMTTQLGMTGSNRTMHDSFNVELKCEVEYNLEVLRETVQRNLQHF